MTRAKVEGQNNQFMEVSGIDPAIVREEQQAAERANSGKPLARDLSQLQQAVNLSKLQQNQAGLPQQYAQADSQALYGGEQTNPDDVRYHSQQNAAHSGTAHHQQYGALPQHNYLGQQQPGNGRDVNNSGAGSGRSAANAAGNESDPAAPQQRSGLMNALAERLSTPPGVGGSRMGKRRVRLGWTEEETRHLMEGCKRHGVGNWKKILTDPSFEFNCRTAVDLKDRFRTSFPEEYSRLYPNARTHKAKRQNSGGEISPLVKINRKERRSFTAEEDERLLQGFLKHGPAWSKIQRDPSLSLSERRSTDLRDRFRNAFPERYTAAGYKGRSSSKNSVAIQSANEIAVSATQLPNSLNVGVSLDDDVHLQNHGIMQSRNYMPPAATMQHPLQLQSMGYQTPAVYFSQMNQMNQMNPNYYRQPHNSQNQQQS